MKTISILTLLAVIAAFMAPKQAMAGDKEKAIIGGLIGGIIIGSVLADDDHNHHTTISYRHGHRDRCDDGHWEWRTEKRWVPGYYRYSRDHCGRSVRVWVSGYYDYHKTKVWVSYRHTDRYRQHSHHGRSYDRYDRRDDRRDRREDRRDHRHHSSSGQIVRNY